MAERLRADYSAMEQGRHGLSTASSGLSEQRPRLRSECDEAISGAGQFGADLADGVSTFALCWDGALAVFSASARLLADNVGQAHLAIQATDEDLGAGVPVAIAGEPR